MKLRFEMASMAEERATLKTIVEDLIIRVNFPKAPRLSLAFNIFDVFDVFDVEFVLNVFVIDYCLCL